MVDKIIYSKFVKIQEVALKINLLFFLIGGIAFLDMAKADFSESQKSYPCIVSHSCQTGGFDPIIQKVIIDYYDDVGCRYRWAHKVASREKLTDCDAAIRAHFPYKYAACIPTASN